MGCTAARPISAPLFDNQFRKIVELKVPAVGLRLGGLREPYMEELEANGISVFGIASNLRDAKVLVSSGVNAVVAAGWAEEGLLSHEEIGKDQAEIDSLVLWSECARALRVPVLGAGSVTTQDQFCSRQTERAEASLRLLVESSSARIEVLRRHTAKTSV